MYNLVTYNMRLANFVKRKFPKKTDVWNMFKRHSCVGNMFKTVDSVTVFTINKAISNLPFKMPTIRYEVKFDRP